MSDRLTDLYDEAPDEGYWPHIQDREAELWEPLLMHARLAGAAEEVRLLDVIGKFSRQKAAMLEDDWRLSQLLALLAAVIGHPEERFSPADLVDALEKG